MSDVRNDDGQAHNAVDEVARRGYAKLVAFLAFRTGDIAGAEDAVSEAFAAALVDWPRAGCPAKPEAWLLTVARRKMIDIARRRRRGDAAIAHLQLMADELNTADADAEIPDHRLALMFACTHPAIETGIRAPLMLQVVLGLEAKTIASAFLASPAAMGKRLVRAKEKIREAGIVLRIPDRGELAGRCEAVLDATYAAFTEGWTCSDVARRDLAEEAIFLARLVAELLPQEPEALGLLALMLYVEARHHARRDKAGEYIPLAEQDPALWNWPMINEAEALLGRANALGKMGRYQLESAVQSAHIHRLRTGSADWEAVVRLYDALLALTGSPVIAINRALAIAELRGAQAALLAMPETTAGLRLADYQPYWAACAELLAKTGAQNEALHAYEVAIGLEPDPAIRRFLQRRAASLPA